MHPKPSFLISIKKWSRRSLRLRQPIFLLRIFIGAIFAVSAVLILTAPEVKKSAVVVTTSTSTTTTSTAVATIPTTSSSEVVRKPLVPTTSRPFVPPRSSLSSNDAKLWIYNHESGNSPCKINGGAVDCNYQGEASCSLGQAYPCSKLRKVCSLSDYACDDAWFEGYAISRYGSWEKAKAHWISLAHWNGHDWIGGTW